MSGESSWHTSAASRRSLVSLYDRRMPGRVVLFHGTSSSGKTTVARAVQRLAGRPAGSSWASTRSGTRSTSAGWSTAHAWPRVSCGRRTRRSSPARLGRDWPGACVPPWRRSPAPVTTCSSMTSSSIPPGSLGWRNELIDVESLLVGVPRTGATSSKSASRARGNRIAGEARAQFEVIHRGNRVRPHRGHVTSVAQRVRPIDPCSAEALTLGERSQG